MRISIIAAMAENRVIGRDNALPWHLPEDLKHFRNLTMGHHILMGRKTFESIGKPLPGRISVVISRNPGFHHPGILRASSIEEAISLCKGDDEIFLIGGAELYRQAIEVADRMYLTEIRVCFEGDASFPEFSPASWREIFRESHSSENGLQFDFAVYDKNRVSCDRQ